ncbi:DUF2141 domain-containing protein [Sphingomonas parva]|uniref:DUF2141 domain-containing protein n=1 Tax=Sphingomonas parva TaxID=2555898 RepID=A0A4Y8ZSY4_9SPHN|nr:DUF2141 domain-containing protein [Sphingomonas parva]TFI58607.1 DUF2141 domain-containing protein [Sphingomonas parva]
MTPGGWRGAGIGRAAAGLGLIGAPLPLLAAETDCTGPESQVRLLVTVEGVRAAEGLIAVTLYADDPKRFLAKRGALYVGRVPARQGRTRVCIHLPSTGIYGLAVYHDADGDRGFDRNALGLPKEGYGFSNNAPTVFGLPRFGAVRFSVPHSGFETRVTLRYP